MDVGTLTVTMGANTAGLARAQAAMVSLQQQTMKSVNSMNASLGTLSAQMTQVATKSKVATQSITAMEKPTVGAMSNVTSALQAVNSGLQRFGYLATTTLTLPIVLAGKAAFSLAKDYEFSIQKIVGLTGVAQSVVKGWEKELLALAPQVGKGPKELADALYFISSSGIKGAEAMNVLKLSAKAAASGLGETQTVADLLTSALNAYRGTGLTAAYATDVLVAAVREGKAEATTFATSMGQVIPIAAQLGVSFDQVAGGMAAITLTGSSAFQAATYLKGVFNSLLKASSQGQAALKLAGTSYSELRNILGNGGVIPLMQKLRDIQTKYGDELLSKVLPNIRALTGYLSISGKNFQYNTELMKRVTASTGSLGQAFAAVADTIKMRYDKAIAGAQVSLISLGKSLAETVIPFLEKMGKKLEELTTWFNSLSDAEKRHKIEILAFMAVIGPASLLLSSLVWIIRGLITVIEGAITVTRVLRVLMISNPWIAALVGVTGLIAGIVMLNKHTNDAAEAQNGFNKALTTVNGSIKLLKNLTSGDYSNMDFNQLAAVRKTANEGYMNAKANIKTAEGRVTSGEVGKGLMQKYIDSQVSAALQFKSAYTMASAALDDLAGKWESNAIAQGNQKFVENTNAATKALLEQKEVLEKLDQAWLDAHAKSQKYTALELNNFIGGKPSFPKAGLNPLKQLSLTPQSIGSDQAKVMGDLAFSLEYINTKETALNRTLGTNRGLYSSITEKINAYSNALEGYLAIPVTERGLVWTEGITNTITQLGLLQKEFDKVERKKAIFNVLTSSFEAFLNTTTSLPDAFKNMADAFISALQRMFAEFMAKKIAMFIMNLIVPGSGSAIGAMGLANGGVIPPGYPNDTYPTMLTSGEMVTPPGKLNAGMFSSGEERLVAVVTGDQLNFILSKTNRKINSYR